MCMCSLVFQDGTCSTIPRALYKCQEVFGKLCCQPTNVNIFQIFHARWNRNLASALLVRLHIGGAWITIYQYLVLIQVFTHFTNHFNNNAWIMVMTRPPALQIWSFLMKNRN